MQLLISNYVICHLQNDQNPCDGSINIRKWQFMCTLGPNKKKDAKNTVQVCVYCNQTFFHCLQWLWYKEFCSGYRELDVTHFVINEVQCAVNDLVLSILISFSRVYFILAQKKWDNLYIYICIPPILFVNYYFYRFAKNTFPLMY